MKKSYKAPEAEKFCLETEPVMADLSVLSNIFPLVDEDDLPAARNL